MRTTSIVDFNFFGIFKNMMKDPVLSGFNREVVGGMVFNLLCKVAQYEADFSDMGKRLSYFTLAPVSSPDFMADREEKLKAFPDPRLLERDLFTTILSVGKQKFHLFAHIA